MLPNPCPCTTLQCGVKALAICSIVGNVLSVLVLIVLLLLGGLVSDALDSIFQEEIQATSLSSQTILIVVLIWQIIALGFDIVLYFGAKTRNDAMCWAWLGFSLLVFLCEVINFIFKHSGYNAIPVTDVISEIFGTALFFYFLFVVYAFIMEIRNEPDPQLNPAYQVSTMAQPQGSVYRAMEAGTTYTASHQNYPIEPRPLQPTYATGF